MPIPDVKKIETAEYERPVAGPWRYLRQRRISEVAAEFEWALETADISGFEYLSYKPYPGWEGDWPRDANCHVMLTVGGNEGYSLYVVLEEFRGSGRDRRAEWRPVMRVKLLSSRDDALAFHALAFHLLGS